ncbi:hypothetical protein [Carboxylicivirga sp. M1479]|uniref:hypothetical protein n=1 Tax=Carboxylicivirga sp. M1479 TaxID=2594476 RepID=UPI001177CED8|nr:hypothetical protein [Carboxylicivirga sp. M1479]TRX72546.1 hypothetical protein FNN09_00990 [Carboxylicivirga sp. M1479]
MTKSEMTTAMFEEIKEMMASLNKKLDTITSGYEKSGLVFQKEAEEQKISITRAEHQVCLLRDSIEDTMSFVKDESSQFIMETNKKVSAWESSIDEVKQSLRKRRVLKIKIFVFQVLFAIAASFCTYLIYENKGLKENGLKYNYLKAINVETPEVSARLDTVFNIQRNEEEIEKIKRIVNDFNN